MMTTEKLIVLMANDDLNDYSYDDFPIGVFDNEENAIEYGISWLESQEDFDETYEDFLRRCNGKPKDYLEEYGLYFYPTSYEPTTNELKKAKLRKEINELRGKLTTLESALDKLEDS